MTMPFPVYLLIPSAVLIIMVGFYSWIRVKKRENLVFFFLSMGQALWALGSFFLWSSCGNDIAVIFWDRTLYFATAMMIPLLYHLSLEICGLMEKKQTKILLPLAYILGFFFAFLTTTSYFVDGVFYYSFGGCHTYARTGHHFFLIYLIAFVSFAFYNLFKTWKSKKQSQEIRDKAYFTLMGYSVFSLAGIGMATAYGIVLYPAYYIFFPLFSLIITYAITEKNLFIVSMATDILIGAILVLVSTFFLFPELEMGVIGKAVIFALLLFSCSLLLKHNHEEIKRKEEAERISKLKTEFISIVSHQLRTPLAAIRGYTDMIKDGDYGVVSKELNVPVNYIHDASVSMIKMVNGLLSVTRLERGKIELKVKYFSIDSMIEGCIKDVELKAKEKGLYLKYEKPEQPLPSVRGDEEKIKHAVMNILNNAILYTVKGGVTIATSVLYSSNVRIAIKDTGVGIEKEENEKIFESFSRGKRGIEMQPQGTGLGLYVARSFITMHKGKITVFSEGRDKGSTFYIDIPVRADIVSKQEFDLMPPELKK